MTWLGHATVLIELDGTRVITDPVLGRRVAHLRRRAPSPAVPAGLDAVLISHQHRDHLHVPSLRALPEGQIVAPAGAERALRRTGRTVRTLAPGEDMALGAVRVRAVRATHDGRRNRRGPPTPALGFIVEGSRRVYFAGDTECFEAMADLAPVDVALIPVWGWGPSLGPGHMDPAQAASAVALLRPAVAIPIHWGTLSPLGSARAQWLGEPPLAFAAEVEARAPATRVTVLAPGESATLA